MAACLCEKGSLNISLNKLLTSRAGQGRADRQGQAGRHSSKLLFAVCLCIVKFAIAEQE